MHTQTDQAAHFEAMAQATYDIAERCEDSEMVRAYLALAGEWLFRAEQARGEAPTGGSPTLRAA